MNKLFVDTSGWVSLFIPTETYHAQAADWFKQVQEKSTVLITTNYVITETVALLGSRQRTARPQIFQYIDSIKQADYVDVIHINLELDSRAWELCKSRPDKAWSLVDCSSFVVMQQLSIQAALTTDKHFEQAGFIRFLK